MKTTVNYLRKRSFDVSPKHLGELQSGSDRDPIPWTTIITGFPGYKVVINIRRGNIISPFLNSSIAEKERPY
jgi:hypothetical protein